MVRVAANRGLNRAVSTAPIPSWVPQIGGVASYTTGDGVLTNTYRSQVAPYYAAFYAIKSVNDFSSGIANPYLGTYGGAVFAGGGHSGTNHNGVIALRANATTLEFINLASGTPYFGTGTDDTTKDDNGAANAVSLSNATYGDPSGVSGESRLIAPSSHTYGGGIILPPAAGGGTYGTYIKVGHAGWLAANSDTIGSSHRMEINSLATATDNPWSRATTDVISGATVGNSPLFNAYVPGQGRVYYVSRNATQPPRWLDLAAEELQENSGGTGFANNTSGDPDSGTLLYVESKGHQLLLSCQRASGALRIEWMDVSDSTPTVGGTVTFSETVPLEPCDPADSGKSWNGAFWCPDNDRICVMNVWLSGARDTTGYYEIEVPATLTDAWTATRRAFAASGSLALTAGWQNWCYLPDCKAAVLLQSASSSSNDTVFAFRPYGT